jgi:hypothetical protein
MTPVYCKDCTYLRPNLDHGEEFNKTRFGRCARGVDNTLDEDELVTGMRSRPRLYYAAVMRREEALCGPTGKLFEPIETIIPTEAESHE